ncbi:7060_t:CDS:10 [Diversispora eburnea]|uniref:7060_t:CDS:1 n=1 Tax=Diversispora eburnea TaxID=1213867 RepID=A0A9N8YJH1_9GLOM|nr:7060_t:CDS:10 [Diversispora eburnea]
MSYTYHENMISLYITLPFPPPSLADSLTFSQNDSKKIIQLYSLYRNILLFFKNIIFPINVIYKDTRTTTTTTNHQRIYFCKIYHARFFPVRNLFEFSLLYFGIDLDLLEKNKDSNGFLLGYNSETLFNINDNDYLGRINLQDNDDKTSIKDKLLWHIEKHDISTKRLKRIELVTMPKILNYAFDPRAFHISTPTSNNRKGIYGAYCKDPASGCFDIRLVNIIYAILTYPLDIFLTMPRILKEIFKLHYSKKLGIYHEPISIEGTVVKLEPTYLELYAQEVIIKYFTNLISQINESLYITINFSNFNQSTIKLQSNPNEIFSPFFHNSKHLILNLYDYSFFTNLLINQNIYRALIVGYFEKAWDSMIRRRYWSKILKNEESGLNAKLEFDKILHQQWPSKGVDENFISSVMQNDVCYDLRIDGEIKSHEKVAIAVRELLAKNEEDNKIVALFGYAHLYLFTIPSNNSIRHLSSLISDKLHLFPFPPPNIWERLKYIWMIFSMTITYQIDSKFWQMTTEFGDGINGNPFLEEKLLWEGIIDILKNGNKDGKLFMNVLEHLQLATAEPSIPKLPIVFTSRRNSNIKSDKQQRLWYFMKCYRKAILFRNDFD